MRHARMTIVVLASTIKDLKMLTNETFEIPDHVVFREMDDRMLVMSLERGGCFALDEIGGRILPPLDSGQSAGSIVETLAAEYDVSPDQCDVDVSAFIDELVSAGFAARAHGR